MASLVSQWVRTHLLMQATWVQSQVGRYPGEGNNNDFSILVLEIPWTEEPGRLQSMESQELDMT